MSPERGWGGVRQWQRGQCLGLCNPWKPHSRSVWGLADVCALKQKPPEKSLVNCSGQLRNRLGQNPRTSRVKLAKGNQLDGGASVDSSPAFLLPHMLLTKQVFLINGPETYGFYFLRNSDVFHNEVENCSENTHQRLPQVLEPSKHILNDL